MTVHKPSLWSRDVSQKIWARSVQPFRRLLDTNKQTDKPNLYKDCSPKFLILEFWKLIGKFFFGFEAIKWKSVDSTRKSITWSFKDRLVIFNNNKNTNTFMSFLGLRLYLFYLY